MRTVLNEADGFKTAVLNEADDVKCLKGMVLNHADGLK
jgi:hypothetical protein